MQHTFESRRVQDRSVGLDALRGLAILGILLVNILAFAFAYIQTFSFGIMADGLADRTANMLVLVLAQGKFITLFTVMFGAGVYLMNRHDVERGNASAMPLSRWRDWHVHLRRMAVLWFIGMIHAYFIWYGDILVQYAVLGMLVYVLLGVPDRWLIISSILYGIGVILLLGLSLFVLLVEFIHPHEIQAAFYDELAIEQEIMGYQGGFFEQMAVRWSTTLEMQLTTFLVAPISIALMLSGVVLVRRGFLLGQSTVKNYAKIGCIAGGIGLFLSIVAWVIADPISRATDLSFSLSFLGLIIIMLVAPATSLAILCVVMIWVKSGWLPLISTWLAKIGRMALTNYLMSSLICGLIFYGHGLGLIGQLTLWQTLMIVPVIWLVILLVSIAWLAVFNYGPMEYLWRSTTYLRFPKIMKDSVQTKQSRQRT